MKESIKTIVGIEKPIICYKVGYISEFTNNFISFNYMFDYELNKIYTTEIHKDKRIKRLIGMIKGFHSWLNKDVFNAFGNECTFAQCKIPAGSTVYLYDNHVVSDKIIITKVLNR